MTVLELDLILDAYREMYPDTSLKDVWMFFDELPLVKDWELFALRGYKSYCRHRAHVNPTFQEKTGNFGNA